MGRLHTSFVHQQYQRLLYTERGGALEYFRPRELTEALNWLAGRDAVVAAGCTDLFPATEAHRLTRPVLDITAIDGLRGIARDDRGWRIGGATRWTDIIRADLPPAFDGLKLAAREVGSIQIQNAGTIAGNLCNASPAADGVPPLLTLAAEVVLSSAGGERRLPLDQFITGPRQTVLQRGEVMTAIHVPAAAGEGRSHFLKLGARKYLVISIAMVSARLALADGRIADAAIAVGACSAVARRLPAVEAALTGQPVSADLSALIRAGDIDPALAPIDDVRADAAYRLHAAAELVRRSVRHVLDGGAV